VIVNSRYTSAHVAAALSAFQLPDLPVKIVTPPVPMIGFDHRAKKPCILSVGRFYVGGHPKRHDALIEVFKKLKASFDGEVELHLAGSSIPEREHQDYLSSLRLAAKDYPVVFHVNCPTEKLHELYRDSIVYWHGTGIGANLDDHPEMAEHFGISIVEAMSGGAIPFALNSGGPREIIRNGVTGFLYDSMDDLAELTVQVLEPKNQERVKRMVSGACVAAKEFSVERFKREFGMLVDEFV
jgi:glycosyltransferase involved in cell wall biosynthesis